MNLTFIKCPYVVGAEIDSLHLIYLILV
jgi:hypothetical protein